MFFVCFGNWKCYWRFCLVVGNTKIGNHNIFQDHSNLGHDSIVGDYSHFYVGTIVCGKNRIEDRVSVFTGAIIYPGIKLESDAVVGAGSVVMRKVKAEQL